MVHNSSTGASKDIFVERDIGLRDPKNGITQMYVVLRLAINPKHTSFSLST
jgi:hypothetical protein